MKHLNLSIPEPSTIHRGFKPLSIGFACVLLLMASEPTFSQAPSLKEQIESAKHRDSDRDTYGHTVSGIVKDEKAEPMAGASIYLKGTTEGTTTDAEGRFEFPRKLNEGDRLTISFVGYESVEYVVQGTIDENIVVVMNVDVIIWGDVAVDEIYTTRPGLRRFFKKLF